MPLAEGTANELVLPALPLSAVARTYWIGFHDHVERALVPSGDLAGCEAFANKLPEHAARIAGVRAVIESSGEAAEIRPEHLEAGIMLAQYYVAEAKRLAAAAPLDGDLERAGALQRWLLDWPEDLISLPDIYQRGPAAIRDKAAAGRAVAILEDHGWLLRVPEGGVVRGVRRRDVWRIIGGGDQ